MSKTIKYQKSFYDTKAGRMSKENLAFYWMTNKVKIAHVESKDHKASGNVYVSYKNNTMLIVGVNQSVKAVSTLLNSSLTNKDIATLLIDHPHNYEGHEESYANIINQLIGLQK